MRVGCLILRNTQHEWTTGLFVSEGQSETSVGAVHLRPASGIKKDKESSDASKVWREELSPLRQELAPRWMYSQASLCPNEIKWVYQACRQLEAGLFCQNPRAPARLNFNWLHCAILREPWLRSCSSS